MTDPTDNVASLEDEQQKQHAERLNMARARVQALVDLMLGEVLTLTPDNQNLVMAVPGGWIFTQTHKAGITSTFVPHPPASTSHKPQIFTG